MYTMRKSVPFELILTYSIVPRANSQHANFRNNIPSTERITGPSHGFRTLGAVSNLKIGPSLKTKRPTDPKLFIRTLLFPEMMDRDEIRNVAATMKMCGHRCTKRNRRQIVTVSVISEKFVCVRKSACHGCHVHRWCVLQGIVCCRNS